MSVSVCLPYLFRDNGGCRIFPLAKQLPASIKASLKDSGNRGRSTSNAIDETQFLIVFHEGLLDNVATRPAEPLLLFELLFEVSLSRLLRNGLDGAEEQGNSGLTPACVLKVEPAIEFSRDSIEGGQCRRR